MGSQISADKSAAKKTGCVSVEEWRAKRDAGLLWCYRCRTWQGGENFTVDRARTTGRAAICRPCNSRRAIQSLYGISRDKMEALETKLRKKPLSNRMDELR